MLAATRRRLLDSLDDGDLVLDVGGWADPFERADWVIDLMPYETRGLYARQGWVPPRTGKERFTKETWVQRDLCAREPFPFADKQFDFAICSHVLEDLRDPLWVCGELVRVAKAGYIEVPSRLEEQSWGVNGPYVGWSHHRWLIDCNEGAIQFVVKLHALHGNPSWYFPAGFWERLAEEERVQTLWWEEGFRFAERAILDDDQAEAYLAAVVESERARRPDSPWRSSRASRARWRPSLRRKPR